MVRMYVVPLKIATETVAFRTSPKLTREVPPLAGRNEDALQASDPIVRSTRTGVSTTVRFLAASNPSTWNVYDRSGTIAPEPFRPSHVHEPDLPAAIAHTRTVAPRGPTMRALPVTIESEAIR